MRAFVRALSRAVGIGVLAAPSCSFKDVTFELTDPAPALAAIVRPAAEPARLEPETVRAPPANPHQQKIKARAVVQEISAPLEAPPLPTVSELPETADPAPDVLVSTSKETTIYARPSATSPKIGYLRAGAVVRRGHVAVGHDGCKGGFYDVSPEGFVCVGAGASLDGAHELARATTRRASRTDAMPYVYGIAKSAGVPLYSRIPDAAEMRAAEPSYDAAHADAHSFDGAPVDDLPWFLADGASSIGVNGYRFPHRSAVLGTAIARTGFAFVSLFESGGRHFGVTVDMAVVPLDRFTRVTPSRFHGVPLDDTEALPVAFVRGKSAALYSGDPKSVGLTFVRRLEFREALSLSGKSAHVGTATYLETKSGEWLQDADLVRIDPLREMPAWAEAGRSWIDVSIDRQALVAYVGTRPVFVTLVSTGVDGKGDPETTHSTIQGQFLIHTKHVSVTMDGDDVGDEFDLRDVPYVQYFKDGFAFHAAYWHDAFGTPRSHGCVNLSPLDARWLFAWTAPSVPTAWHGAMSNHGTLVSIHP